MNPLNPAGQTPSSPSEGSQNSTNNTSTTNNITDRTDAAASAAISNSANPSSASSPSGLTFNNFINFCKDNNYTYKILDSDSSLIKIYPSKEDYNTAKPIFDNLRENNYDAIISGGKGQIKSVIVRLGERSVFAVKKEAEAKYPWKNSYGVQKGEAASAEGFFKTLKENGTIEQKYTNNVPGIGIIYKHSLWKQEPNTNAQLPSEIKNPAVNLPNDLSLDEYNQMRKLAQEAVVNGKGLSEENIIRFATKMAGISVEATMPYDTNKIGINKGKVNIHCIFQSGLNLNPDDPASGGFPIPKNNLNQISTEDVNSYYENTASRSIKSADENKSDILVYNPGIGGGFFCTNRHKDQVKQANVNGICKALVKAREEGSKLRVVVPEVGYTDNQRVQLKAHGIEVIRADKGAVAAIFTLKGLKVSEVIASDPMVMIGIHGPGFWWETVGSASDEERAAYLTPSYALAYIPIDIHKKGVVQAKIPAISQYMRNNNTSSAAAAAAASVSADPAAPTDEEQKTHYGLNKRDLKSLLSLLKLVHEKSKIPGGPVGQQNYITLDLEGKSFQLWYNDKDSTNDKSIINIQLASASGFTSRSASQTSVGGGSSTSTKKLGIAISEEGDLITFSVDGGNPTDAKNVPKLMLTPEMKTRLDKWLAPLAANAAVEANRDKPWKQLPNEVIKECVATWKNTPSPFDYKEKGNTTTYNYWKKPLGNNEWAYNIQDKTNYNKSNSTNKIGFKVSNDGTISSIWVNGKEKDTDGKPFLSIPQIFLGVVNQIAVDKLVQIKHTSGSENNKVLVDVHPKTIKAMASYHLTKFSEAAEKAIRGANENSRPQTSIIFKDGSNTQQGLDWGGVTSQYISDIFSSITSNETTNLTLLTPEDAPFPTPHTTAIKGSDINPYPILSSGELRSYESIGKVFMFCFHSKNPRKYVTGRNFDPKLFKAIQMFDSGDLQKDFGNVEEQKKDQIALHLMKSKGNSVYSLAAKGFEQKYSNLTDNELTTLCACIEFDDDFKFKDGDTWDNVQYNADKIKSNIDKIAPKLKENFYSLVAREVAPLHAIAKGMHATCDMGNTNDSQKSTAWKQTIQSMSPTTLCDSIQGSLNREKLANSITTNQNYPFIIERAKWIKEWINDQSTKDKDIKEFLQHVTGGTALPPGSEIKVVSRHLSQGLMAAHTCFKSLDIEWRLEKYPEGTNPEKKEGFINLLKMFSAGSESFTEA